MTTKRQHTLAICPVVLLENPLGVRIPRAATWALEVKELDRRDLPLADEGESVTVGLCRRVGAELANGIDIPAVCIFA